MASSHVEVLSSSHRFGSILRDRNQNAVVSHKAYVKDHHRELFKSPVNDENSDNLVNSWIETHNNNNNKPIVRKSRVLVPPVEESRRNGASSLVQIWEARLNQSTASNSRIDAGVSVHDSLFSEGESESAHESENAEASRTVEIESSSNGSVSHSGESTWGRVADLIRRLSNDDKLNAGDNGGGGRLAIIRTPKPCVSMVNFSPRIRGRQAFTDLLMQMERDRHRELESLRKRNAVSTFAQLGRLQSMLRLRNLKRCLAIQDQHRFNSKTTGLNRIEPGSAVLHLREKFSTKSVHVVEDQRKDYHRFAEMKNKTVEETERSTMQCTKLSNTGRATERSNMSNRKITDEATLCKEEETINKIVESKMNCLEQQETRNADTCVDSKTEKKEEKKTSPSAYLTQEPRLRQDQDENHTENCMKETPETQTQGVVHESNEMNQFLEQQETFYSNGWEEQEEYGDEQYYYGETNNDWLSEISRPKSYWEELRKSRYLEVMNTRSDKEDIRRLLDRRTVTDFLKSGLREQIDKLMMSRVQTHSNKNSEKWEEEEKHGTEEEEPLTEGGDKDDSSRSSSSHMFASSPAGSWSSQDTELTSTHVLSLHNPLSPEMELISCMRSQIQQLQQEMSLLRDSVKTCLDANVTLGRSVCRENPQKRKCCLCDETQVEAVLYKCGHMCTCLKCANELHCSGGKCPICRAQIIDVVRVFF